MIDEGHVESIDGAFLDEACCLQLPDGRIVHGRPEDLPNDRICANGTVLREERESGVSHVAFGEQLCRIETQGADNSRLLHRVNYKVDGVPPLIQRVKEKNRPLSVGAAKLLQKVRLSSSLWETYTDHWQNGKSQTQIAVERGLSKKDAYKINRECKAIEKAFSDAGEPIPDKLTRHNAEIAEDGEIVKKKGNNPHSWV